MKQKVMNLHRYLIKEGSYNVARKVFRFLKDGSIKLYLTDDDWAVDNHLTKLGYIPFIDGRGYATFRINRYKENTPLAG